MASASRDRTFRLPRHWRNASSAVIIAMCASVVVLATLSVATRRAPVAHAGDACSSASLPCVSWASNLSYPGVNNGNPAGPVWEHVSFQGSNFAAYNGMALQAKLVPGDLNAAVAGGQSAADFCNTASTSVAVGNAVTVQNGTFGAKFGWPDAASSGSWSVCIFNESTDGKAIGNLDSGVFTVLAKDPPIITSSPIQVDPGGSVSVSGNNFVPPQPLRVIIDHCRQCNTPIVTQQVSSTGSSGTFSATLTIPPDTAPGDYFVSVANASGSLDTATWAIDWMGVTVKAPPATAVPTATPSPTPTLSPTPTETATATTTTAAVPPTPQDSANTGGGTNSGVLIIAVLGFALLVATLAGLALYLISQRRNAATPDRLTGSVGVPSVPATGPDGWGAGAPPSMGYPTSSPWGTGGQSAAPPSGGVSPDWPTDPGLFPPR